MNIKEILSKVDHTQLSVTATKKDIELLCADAVKYGCASVCVAPSFVKTAKELTAGKTKVCTVIGFPNGYSTTSVKCFETKDALENGADEIDMVINIGALKDKRYDEVLNEIKAVKEICGDKILKVIIETCVLSKEEKIRMCNIVSLSGADYIKTSTGFSHGGATREDIELFSKYVESHVKIKAAGGISTLKDARDMIELGAQRLGTSRIVKLVKESEQENI